METNFVEQAYFVSQIIAAVAVVLSLVYVGHQVKQSTKAIRLSTTHNIAQAFREQYLMIADDSGVAKVWLSGMNNAQPPEGEEALRFFASMHNLFRIYEDALYQHQNGALDQELFSGMEQQFIDFSSLPGVRNYWTERARYFSPALQERFGRYIADSANKSPHRLAGIKVTQ